MGTPEEGALLFQPPITVEQIEAAKVEPLNYVENSFNITSPHFVFYVQDQITKMCAAGLFQAPGGIPCEKVVTQGGLRITTTLDLGLQGLGKTVIAEEIAATEARYGGHNGSLVAIRPGTGEILAMVGSRDHYNVDIAGEVNIATSAAVPRLDDEDVQLPHRFRAGVGAVHLRR